MEGACGAGRPRSREASAASRLNGPDARYDTASGSPDDRQGTEHQDVLLEVDGLRTWFHTPNGVVRAVDGMTLKVRRGETVCLVGESGCGKSVTGLAIMRLIDSPGRIEQGSRVIFDGTDLLTVTEKDMEKVRGNEIAMVFQEPMSSLNPVRTVGTQIVEAIRLHRNVSRKEAHKSAEEALGLVGIPSPRERLGNFPHEMSGGMRQRVVIAMAISCRPKLLIADEPTTALDVTVQAQIIELLEELQREFGMSLLHITHDLGVVAETADRVAVAYGGRVVEEGPAAEVFAHPQHPYTEALLRSIPVLGMTHHQPLSVIRGMVPGGADWPAGCRFAPRCDYAFDKCAEYPPMYRLPSGQVSACWLCQSGPRPVSLLGAAGVSDG